ncbi:MAG: hypothetical protein ACLFR8_05660 [Alkalispirochaeta sp.]
MKRVFILAMIVAAACINLVGAQDNGVSLRRGFRDVELGASFDVTESALIRDPAFQYRGRPDITMALSDRERVIDTRGRVYMERGVFSFHDNRLFSISLYLSRRRLDYFQLFDQLRERYGDPRDLDPERAIWEDGTTRIELERPLTVRYLDLAMFEERRDRAETAEALEEVTREQFLEEF